MNNKIKSNILDPSPHKLALTIYILILILIFIAPLNFEYISWSYIYLIYSIFFFISSSFFIQLFQNRKYNNIYYTLKYSIKIKKIITICLIFSLFGVIIRFIDIFFIRNFDFSHGLASLRITLQSLTYSSDSDVAQANIISAVSAFLFGFTYPLTILFIIYRKYLNKHTCYLCFTLLLAPILDNFLTAGILGATFTLTYIFYCYFYSTIINNKKINLKFILKIFLIFITVLFVGFIFYTQRIELMFGSINTFISYNNNLLQPNEFLLKCFDVPFLKSFAFGIYWFLHYILQGLSEFSYLLDNFDHANILYGKKQFFILDKFFSILFENNYNTYDLSILNPRPGRYQTFYGDVFIIDFGFSGLIFESTIFGVILSQLYLSRKRGQFIGIILYPFFQATVIFSPLFNSFSSSRFYFLFSGLTAFVIYRFLIKKEKYENRNYT
ncbi:O-antigen polymerase [Desulfomicrobium apsheronum]|nr:O-antigen polymerase [Desulfomicrobium apsheronum]